MTKALLMFKKTSLLSLSSSPSLPSSDRRGQASNSPYFYLLLTTQSQGLDFLPLAWRGCLTFKYFLNTCLCCLSQCLSNTYPKSTAATNLTTLQCNRVEHFKLFLHFNLFCGHMCLTRTHGTCVEVREHLAFSPSTM